MLPTRRSLLTAFLAVPALPVCNRAAAQQPTLPLTPACRDDDDLTPALTAGPFYKPDAPLRHDLSGDAPDGERITIAGYVLDGNCRPIARSLVEIWHADETGAYDTRGYRLRGHQVTDERGRWWFSTIIPALYPGRNEPQNDGDRLYSPSLLLDLRDTEDGKFGRFDFVV
ncbi:intradiol ring-cleavage dioxygenase [Sinorhizobium medicae]|nr:intradiol ring-cleavage dioxygenase [Sinorhizobium medicae]